ncbi:MAG: hypothetical protein KTR31_19420 [Myxococcales bacterium]|nr:hypothetical protein [Myxococcales bacterium]
MPGSDGYSFEELFAKRELQEGLTRINVRLRTTPDSVPLLWMKVRFMFEIAELRADDPEFDRSSWYPQMVDTAKRATKVAPTDPMARWWRGVAMAQLGATRGVLASLMMANSIRRDFESVAPDDATIFYRSLDGYHKLPCDAYYALAQFYRLVPDRAVARALTRTKGGLDVALDYARRSTTCDPVKVQNFKELGMVQLCMAAHRSDEALRDGGVAALKHAQSLPARNGLEKMDHAHIERILADPSLACGYTRIGQQQTEAR